MRRRRSRRRSCANASSRRASGNAHRPGPLARREAHLSSGAEELLARAVEHMALTGRGFDRIIKVARTVADLNGADRVSRSHVAEALSYRTAFEHDEDLARAG